MIYIYCLRKLGYNLFVEVFGETLISIGPKLETLKICTQRGVMREKLDKVIGKEHESNLCIYIVLYVL